MKLAPNDRGKEGSPLKNAKAFRALLARVERDLATNPVVSDAERKAVSVAGRKILEVLSEVLGRSSRSRIQENSELYDLPDIELGVKLEGRQPELLYLVGLATTVLEKLVSLKHLTETEYEVLKRYWRSLPIQHQLLSKRWNKALD